MNKVKTSLRTAINQKCKDCIYDPQAEGTWRSQVASCPSNRCPLFSVRPKPIEKRKQQQGE